MADLYDAVDDSVLSRIADLVAPADHLVAGHDFYPVGVTRHGGGERQPLTISDRIDAYQGEARAWHERYGRDFWVAETSNLGLPVDQQEEWLIALVARLDAMRADGLPVRGLCWYSRGDQYDWDTMLMEPVGKVTTVGLFDAQRRSRPVADAYRRLARRQ